MRASWTLDSSDAQRIWSGGPLGRNDAQRIWGGARSVYTSANSSGQNGRRASSQAVSAIDWSVGASSGACLCAVCAGGPAGAGAGAGVSDAVMRTQMSHKRIVQHRPDVSQAWSTRRTPLRRLRLPGAERSPLKPPAFELLAPSSCSWNLTTRAGPNWTRVVLSLRSNHALNKTG